MQQYSINLGGLVGRWIYKERVYCIILVESSDLMLIRCDYIRGGRPTGWGEGGGTERPHSKQLARNNRIWKAWQPTLWGAQGNCYYQKFKHLHFSGKIQIDNLRWTVGLLWWNGEENTRVEFANILFQVYFSTLNFDHTFFGPSTKS